MGEAAYVLFKSKYNIICFCDNDKDKWGKKFCGLEIIPPENLKTKELSNVNIIIASMYSKEIQNQLIEYGVKKERIQLADFKVESFLKNLYEDNECKSLKNMIDSFRKSKDYNLHIMPDSVYSKSFIEFVNLHFNKDEHKFIILTDFKIELEYMDNIDSFENVEVIYYNKYAELKLYFYVKNSRKLFIHYLTDFMCKFINEYEVWNETELNWIIWGGDLYQYIDFELYDEETKKLIDTDKKNLISKNNSICNKYRIKTIENIHNILTGTKGDYLIVKKNYKTSATLKRFFYPNTLNFSDLNQGEIVLSQKYNFKRKFKYVILVGNSGDPSNNHLEIFNKLKEINSGEFCVICPLSYGNKDYITKIVDYGKRFFNDKFIPLLNFLDKRVYLSILNQIDAAFMNHNRQQAFGNIAILLYKNKNVFLKERNNLYQLLRENNVKVSNIDSVNWTNFFQCIDQYVVNNRENIIKLVSNDRLLKYYNELF